ncbi:MAG: hypothetical protein RLZZ142_2009 [Verrucomicrobiota bacterium]
MRPPSPSALQPIPRRTFLGTLLSGALLQTAHAEIPQPGGHAAQAFHLDPDWPKLSPDVYPERCQMAGVAIAKDGCILALNRGENPWDPRKGFRKTRIQKPAVLVIDPGSGELQSSWGKDSFIMPHQISVAPSGNVWITDVGLSSVFEFDPQGKPIRELTRASLGFNMPTDIAFLRDGSLLISDGYGNTRVVLLDPAGKLLASWGSRGSAPLQFRTPHSITVDPEDRIYVADRENHRIQVLDHTGKVEALWTHVERPLTVRFAAGSLFVLSNLDAPNAIVRRLSPRGEVLESFHTLPEGSSDDFQWPHGMAVSTDGHSVYVGFTLTSRRIQRYVRRV